MTPDMMHDAGPDVSRFGNKGFHPAPIAGRKARSGNIIVRRTRDRKSTRLNSSHSGESRMPSSA